MDECTNGTHGCSHICNNTVGGYTCSCPIGFQISSDPKICKGSLLFLLLIVMSGPCVSKIENTKEKPGSDSAGQSLMSCSMLNIIKEY